jgi:hypothetical protein
MEEDIHMTRLRRWWGLRPWKRHSTILMVVGFLYALVGFQYIVSGSTPSRERALAVLLQFAPIQFWGAVFIFAGALSMVSSRWPPITETWGYMVLTGVSTGWSATNLTGILFFHSSVANVTQVILWGCLGFIWWAISGLLNPDKTAVTNYGRL